jgi:hypothetical protein
MIVKGYIQSTLEELEKLYDEHKSLKKDIYYSKLALLELCGWIEESFDSIIKTSIAAKIKSNGYRKILQDIIKRNHGFQVGSNFRPMLIQAVGLQKTEKIELKLDSSGKVQILSTTLGNLKKVRDDNAHTFIRGTTTTIQTPSVTKAQFALIFPIIKEFEKEVKK